MKDQQKKRGTAKRKAAEAEPPKSKKRRGPPNPLSILAPRDERGTPYPGDFPNPLRGKTRDCF